MLQIDQAELDRLLDTCQLVMGRREKPWLLRTPGGDALKFFYRRKRFSSTLLRSAAARFAANGRKLAQRGIVAPVVTEIGYCPALPAHLVRYPWLDGEDLRARCAREGGAPLGALTGYLARLHAEGIYFRAIHLGNLLQLSDEGLGLLDITDLRPGSRPLGAFARARNLAHLFANDEDAEAFARYGPGRFLEEYLAAARLTPQARSRLLWRLRRALPRPFDLGFTTGAGQATPPS